MNFGTGNNQEDETNIELTPLIDVVFLLLIFCMISTTFTKETSLKINLPESAGEQAAVEVRNVEIQISEKSQYALAVDNDSAKVLINSSRDTLIRALEPFNCLLYTSPSPRDRQKSRMPSSA